MYQTFQKIKQENKIKNVYLKILITSGNKNRFITIKPRYLVNYDSF